MITRELALLCYQVVKTEFDRLLPDVDAGTMYPV